MTEGSGGGSVQSYNAQVAVTDDHLILGVHVSQDANDLNCYTPTLDAATAQATALGKTIELVLADAGYFTQHNLAAPGPDRLIAPGKNRDTAAQARDNPAHQPPPPDTDPPSATPCATGYDNRPTPNATNADPPPSNRSSPTSRTKPDSDDWSVSAFLDIELGCGLCEFIDMPIS